MMHTGNDLMKYLIKQESLFINKLS